MEPEITADLFVVPPSSQQEHDIMVAWTKELAAEADKPYRLDIDLASVPVTDLLGLLVYASTRERAEIEIQEHRNMRVGAEELAEACFFTGFIRDIGHDCVNATLRYKLCVIKNETMKLSSNEMISQVMFGCKSLVYMFLTLVLRRTVCVGFGVLVIMHMMWKLLCFATGIV